MVVSSKAKVKSRREGVNFMLVCKRNEVGNERKREQEKKSMLELFV